MDPKQTAQAIGSSRRASLFKKSLGVPVGGTGGPQTKQQQVSTGGIPPSLSIDFDDAQVTPVRSNKRSAVPTQLPSRSQSRPKSRIPSSDAPPGNPSLFYRVIFPLHFSTHFIRILKFPFLIFLFRAAELLCSAVLIARRSPCCSPVAQW